MVHDLKSDLQSQWAYGPWFILLSPTLGVHEFQPPHLVEHNICSSFLWSMAPTLTLGGHSYYSPLLGSMISVGPYFGEAWLLLPTLEEYDFSTSPFMHTLLLTFYTFCTTTTLQLLVYSSTRIRSIRAQVHTFYINQFLHHSSISLSFHLFDFHFS